MYVTNILIWVVGFYRLWRNSCKTVKNSFTVTSKTSTFHIFIFVCFVPFLYSLFSHVQTSLFLISLSLSPFPILVLVWAVQELSVPYWPRWSASVMWEQWTSSTLSRTWDTGAASWCRQRWVDYMLLPCTFVVNSIFMTCPMYVGTCYNRCSNFVSSFYLNGTM